MLAFFDASMNSACTNLAKIVMAGQGKATSAGKAKASAALPVPQAARSQAQTAAQSLASLVQKKANGSAQNATPQIDDDSTGNLNAAALAGVLPQLTAGQATPFEQVLSEALTSTQTEQPVVGQVDVQAQTQVVPLMIPAAVTEGNVPLVVGTPQLIQPETQVAALTTPLVAAQAKDTIPLVGQTQQSPVASPELALPEQTSLPQEALPTASETVPNTVPAATVVAQKNPNAMDLPSLVNLLAGQPNLASAAKGATPTEAAGNRQGPKPSSAGAKAAPGVSPAVPPVTYDAASLGSRLSITPAAKVAPSAVVAQKTATHLPIGSDSSVDVLQVAAGQVATQAVAPTASTSDISTPKDSSPAAQVAKALGTGPVPVGRQIVIQLDPPALGKVRLTLHERGDQIHGVLRVEDPGTLAQLRQETPLLLHRLSQSGLDVGRIDVMPSSSASMPSWSFDQAHQDGAGGRQNSPWQDSYATTPAEDAPVSPIVEEYQSLDPVGAGSFNAWA